MTLSKAKFFISILAAAVIGASLTFGGYKAFEKPEENPSPAPTETVTPSPSPSATAAATPTAVATPPVESDQDQILRVSRAFTTALAASGGTPAEKYTIAKIQGNFAKVNAGSGFGGGFIILKKANGTWVPLWQGNGSISQELIDEYGIPSSIIEER